ncbi:MAG: hypothetical protein ABIB98_00540 [bacterium]
MIGKKQKAGGAQESLMSAHLRTNKISDNLNKHRLEHPKTKHPQNKKEAKSQGYYSATETGSGKQL